MRSLILTTSMFLSTTAAAAVCPDFESRACVERIRSLIDALDYVEARDEADRQCYDEPAPGADGRVPAAAMVATASGCHYLFLIERYLGNGQRAVEAREKARGIAAFGCSHGRAELCEAQAALLGEALDEMLVDVERDLKDGKQGGEVQAVDVSRELGRAFQQRAEAGLRRVLAAAGAGVAPGRQVIASVRVEGGGLQLRIQIREGKAERVLWERTYASKDVAERQRLFGFGARVPEPALRAKLANEHKSVYKVLLGVGGARLRNLAGGAAENERLALHVRSAERFGSGRHEIGALMSLHVTRRGIARAGKKKAKKKTESSVEAVEEGAEGAEPAVAAAPAAPTSKVPAYATAFGIGLIYNRMLFDGRESYDAVRPSLNASLGIFGTGSFMAPAGRVGLDLFFARRFVLGANALFVAPTTTLTASGEEEVKVPAARGGEIMMSISL